MLSPFPLRQTRNPFRKVVFKALALSTLLLAGSAHIASAITVAANDSNVRYTGRVDYSTPTAPVLYWAGNEVSLAFQGTSLTANLTCKVTSQTQYLNVIVDGGTPTTLAVSSRRTTPTTYTIASGLAQGNHTARIIRRNDWDVINGLSVNGFTVTGNPASVVSLPARPSRRIEFYGDSISTGMGNLDPSVQNDMSKEDNYLAYSAVTARALSAELSCISRSGIGIVKSWYPDTLPQVYNRTNPFVATGNWNFNSWTPDVVVVNVGQNDYWLISPTDRTTMENAYKNFYATIRSKYPNALIVAALGSMDAVSSGSPFPSYVVNAAAAMNDPKIVSYVFPLYAPTAHPNVSQHQQMANDLAPFISNAMGWSGNPTPTPTPTPSPTPTPIPGTNLIVNPSFDAEAFDTQTPSGWSEWSGVGGVGSGYTESNGGSNSGARHGSHYNTIAYNMYTFQSKTGLANGLYTLRAYARRSGNQTSCTLEAKDFGGATVFAPIPVSSTYQLVEIKDINVTNGQCTVGIWSNAQAWDLVFFDDVSFFKQ